MIKLLIADDEALIRLTLADILEAEGFDVTLASGGAEAVATARKLGGKPSALVTDLDMPGFRGEDLIRTLRVNWPSLPVVVITGSAPPGGAEALRRHCGGHRPLTLVQKPFTCAGVIDAVQQVLTTQADLHARAAARRVPLGSSPWASAQETRPTLRTWPARQSQRRKRIA